MLRETVTVDPVPTEEASQTVPESATPAPASMSVAAAAVEASAAALEAPAGAAAPPPEPHGEETGEHMGEGFSETQWFMAAVDPESLKEEAVAPDDVMELQGKYRRDASIPEEQRSRFTLRRKKGK